MSKQTAAESTQNQNNASNTSSTMLALGKIVNGQILVADTKGNANAILGKSEGAAKK